MFYNIESLIKMQEKMFSLMHHSFIFNKKTRMEWKLFE